MISIEQLNNLPDDPRDAFITFARIIREEIELDVENYQNSPSTEMEYEFNHSFQLAILNFQEYCDTMIVPDFKIPMRSTNQSDVEFYYGIMNAVEKYEISNKYRRFRLTRGANLLEIRLEHDYREEIHKHIGKIRTIVAQVELTDRKRTSILNKLNSLAAEVDRPLTRTEALGALMIDLLDGSEQVEKLEPAVKLLERIASVFGKAKREEIEAIKPPEEKMLLEGPDNIPTSEDDS